MTPHTLPHRESGGRLPIPWRSQSRRARPSPLWVGRRSNLLAPQSRDAVEQFLLNRAGRLAKSEDSGRPMRPVPS